MSFEQVPRPIRGIGGVIVSFSWTASVTNCSPRPDPARCVVETAQLSTFQLCDAESGKGDAAIKSQTLGLL
jgi:hypothetical protein